MTINWKYKTLNFQKTQPMLLGLVNIFFYNVQNWCCIIEWHINIRFYEVSKQQTKVFATLNQFQSTGCSTFLLSASGDRQTGRPASVSSQVSAMLPAFRDPVDGVGVDLGGKQTYFGDQLIAHQGEEYPNFVNLHLELHFDHKNKIKLQNNFNYWILWPLKKVHHYWYFTKCRDKQCKKHLHKVNMSLPMMWTPINAHFFLYCSAWSQLLV